MTSLLEVYIKHVYPSPTVNHCHAMLNALRAALHGEESRLLSRHLLGLDQELETHDTLLKELDYVEELFESFTTQETIIICLDETESLQTLFHQQLSILPDSAEESTLLIQKLKSETEDIELTAQELVAYFIGHARARETYIDGLIQYADTFNLSEMAEHWSQQSEATDQLIQNGKELLVELSESCDYSNYLLHRIYDYTVLIPSSLLCQMHDMMRILHLEQDYITFEQAMFDKEEAEAWETNGLDAEQAGYWRAYGISPEAFLAWVEYGFLEPKIAGVWKVRGFTPEEADAWALAGFDPSEADLFRVSGIDDPTVALAAQEIAH